MSGLTACDLMAGLEKMESRPALTSCPIHLQPVYRERFGYRPGDFPVTEQVARTTLALPFFTDMTQTQVDYVCDCLSKRLDRQRYDLVAVSRPSMPWASG